MQALRVHLGTCWKSRSHPVTQLRLSFSVLLRVAFQC